MSARTSTMRSLLTLTAAAMASGCETPVELEVAGLDDAPDLAVANAGYDTWTLVDLGVANSRALDVNAHRQVVGTRWLDGSQHGFLWDNGVAKHLPDFAPNVIADNGLIAGRHWGRPAVQQYGSTHYLLPGNAEGHVADMNNAGTVVGSMIVAGTNLTQPFLWKDGTVEILPFYGRASAVSPGGYVSGFATGGSPGDAKPASGVWVRTPSGVTHFSSDSTSQWVRGVDDYGTAVTARTQGSCLRPNWVRPGSDLNLTGIACGVPQNGNQFGHVVTNHFDVPTSEPHQAQLFIRASQVRTLLGFGASAKSWASDISDSSNAPRVAGDARRADGSGPHAVVWSYGNGGRPSALPEGRHVTISTAVAINSNGDAAGTQFTIQDGDRAALWTRN